jgi:molybdopterin synthase catalytic subunit
LVGWLPANFSAGSALFVFCGWVRAAAKHSVLTSSSLQKEKQVFKERVRPFAATILKKSHGCGMQSFLRTAL